VCSKEFLLIEVNNGYIRAYLCVNFIVLMGHYFILETVLAEQVFFREMHRSTCGLFVWNN
jgi:hypothetical protein